MNRLKCLLLLMIGITTPLFAALPPTNNRMLDVWPPLFKGSIEYGITALYLRPSYSDWNFGLTFPTPTAEEGIYKAPASSYDFGYQVNFGYQFPCSSNDVMVTFQDYTQTEDDNIATGFFFPNPSSFTIAPANDIATFNKVEIKNRFVDLDCGQFINIDQYVSIRLLAGVRYSALENTLKGGVIDPTLAIQAAQTVLENQKSTFKGLGPRLGGQGVLHIGAGVGLVGSLSTATIVGYTKSFLATTEIFSLNSNYSDYHMDTTLRVVPNLEGKLGLNFKHQFRNCSSISVEAGYYVNQYFNSIDWLSKEGLVAPELRTRHTIDTSFSGTYASLQVVM